MTYNVVITGGAASGKSVVANTLSNLGVKIIDTDLISKELTTENGAAISKIKKKFGTEVIEKNALNRSKMREIVFNNKNRKKELEAILHPLINDQIKSKVNQINKNNPNDIIAIQIPLFFETEAEHDFVDLVITIESEKKLQIARMIKYRGLTEDIANKINNSQAKPYQRKKVADIVINNNSTIKDLQIATRYYFYKNIKFH